MCRETTAGAQPDLPLTARGPQEVQEKASGRLEVLGDLGLLALAKNPKRAKSSKKSKGGVLDFLWTS